MEKKMAEKKIVKRTIQKCHPGGCGGMTYCVGFIGAAVYYISTATGFWNGVVGFAKAVVWPAFLVFELLKFLGT